MKDIEKLLQTAEVRSELLFHEASIAVMQGDNEKAIECFQASLVEDPQNINSRKGLEQIQQKG
jgi:hypothetical protein